MHTLRQHGEHPSRVSAPWPSKRKTRTHGGSYVSVTQPAMRSIAPHTSPRLALAVVALATLATTACGESPPPNAYMTTPGGGDRYARSSLSLGEARLRPEVCSGVQENKPDQTR